MQLNDYYLGTYYLRMPMILRSVLQEKNVHNRQRYLRKALIPGIEPLKGTVGHDWNQWHGSKHQTVVRGQVRVRALYCNNTLLGHRLQY